MDYDEHLISFGNLVIAFASEDQTRFQWGRFLGRLNISHVLLRDSLRRWYQDGILPFAGRDALTSYIRSFVLRGYKVTALGLSAGAYAALLYGKLAQIDRVIAISPVTGADGEKFPMQWRHRFAPSAGDPSVEDLIGIYARRLPRYPLPDVIAFVSDGPDCGLDRHMAERIGVSDIRLIPGFDHGGLARGLRDNGTLEALLRQ